MKGLYLGIVFLGVILIGWGWSIFLNLLTTQHDRYGNPLIIVQGKGSATSPPTVTPSPTETPSPTPEDFITATPAGPGPN